METPTLDTLFRAQLGDIIHLPDARRATIRAIQRHLGVTVGSMTGFMLAGEIGPSCVLLSLPDSPARPIGLYVPLPKVPDYARSAVEVAAGVISYWSPHAVGLSGAMGELGYKVASVRGQVEPMVLLWRGEEMVVFVKSMDAQPHQLTLEALRRDSAATEKDVALHTSRVTTPDRVAPLPVPELVPAHHQ